MNPNIPTANALRYDPSLFGQPTNTLAYNEGINMPEGISRLCDQIEDFYINEEDPDQEFDDVLYDIDTYKLPLLFNQEITESVKNMCMRRLNRTRELVLKRRKEIKLERQNRRDAQSSISQNGVKSSRSNGGKRSRSNGGKRSRSNGGKRSRSNGGKRSRSNGGKRSRRR